MRIIPSTPEQYTRIAESNLVKKGSAATGIDFAKAARGEMFKLVRAHTSGNPLSLRDEYQSQKRISELLQNADKLLPNNPYVKMSQARALTMSVGLEKEPLPTMTETGLAEHAKETADLLKRARAAVKQAGHTAATHTQDLYQSSSIVRQTKALLRFLK